MSKNYLIKFGSTKASTYTGLSPTFTIFRVNGITAVTSPGITETPASSGLYSFVYGPTTPVFFEVDGTATITTAADRYVYGVLDPIQAVNENIAVLGNGQTSIAGLIGTTASSFGSTSVDPGDLYGFLKRIQEILEGDATFTKSSGAWNILSRGSSTLLRVKTVANSTTAASKS